MRPDGSLRPPDLPSVLRLILAITDFLCNQAAVKAEGPVSGPSLSISGECWSAFSRYPTPGSVSMNLGAAGSSPSLLRSRRT